ncbi:hypothetical protein N0V82_010549 [Gnomoniopsis sp. IMI 355080]|nr:hypothetical protein N0V82_010549 [Gnomoniopsis sp. IMI 355080]
MASIFILFPKDNAEYAPAALQHFQWAVERFETMSERNRLAAAARGVLHAIHVRLKKALGVSGASVMPSVSPALLPATAISSKATPASSASASSNNPDPHGISSSSSTAAAGGVSPSLTNTRTSSIFTPSGGESSSLSAPSEPYFGAGPPIDPSLSGGGGGGGSLTSEQQQQEQGAAWALPEGFDWGSIQPVYAMADVAYNDLMGISSNGGAEAAAAGGGSGGGGSIPHWAGGALLLNDEASGSMAEGGDGNTHGWSFGGDFGNDSVWSVLNHYPAQFAG